jgi:hypothetical protein
MFLFSDAPPQSEMPNRTPTSEPPLNDVSFVVSSFLDDDYTTYTQQPHSFLNLQITQSSLLNGFAITKSSTFLSFARLISLLRLQQIRIEDTALRLFEAAHHYLDG